jgi:archaellum component FlaC
MQADGKKDGIATGVATGLKGFETDAVEAGTRALQEIAKEIEAGAPFSSIRQEYAAPLDALVKLAGQARDVNLLARLHSVLSILEAEDSAPGKRGLLTAQVSQVEKMLLDRVSEARPAAKGIIASEPAPAHAPPPQADFCEDVLRSLPPIGDQEIKILKAQGLLDAEKLLNADPLELARMTGMATNTAFELKERLRRIMEQRARQDIERRVAELSMINEQLSAECERITAANNTLLMNNKSLKSQYPVISEQYDQEVKNFKDLQSRVVSARIESNRLSTEINFLKEEHQKLLDLVEEKHLLLDDLFRRFHGIRCGFEFVSGETAFAQDMMTNVEGLLNKALTQKKLLSDKIASSEESIEKLFSEFNEIVRKGKIEFYRSI